MPVAAGLLLTACGNDPAPAVAVPGAPGPVTTVRRATTTTSTSLAPVTAPSTTAVPTTVAPTTTTPPTTVTETTTTTAPAPATTVAVPATTTPAPTTTELVYVPEAETGTLRFPMEGPRTLQLQRDLITLGYLPAGADDGLYGPGTAGGVRRFQEDEGLVVDGVAGPITQERLAQVLAGPPEDPPADG